MKLYDHPAQLASEMWKRFCGHRCPDCFEDFMGCVGLIPIGFCIPHMGVLMAWFQCAALYVEEAKLSDESAALKNFAFLNSLPMMADAVRGNPMAQAEYGANRWLFTGAEEDAQLVREAAAQSDGLASWLRSQEDLAEIFEGKVLQ